MWTDHDAQWRHVEGVDERAWEILRATEEDSYHSLRRVIASALAWAEDHPRQIAAFGGADLDDVTLEDLQEMDEWSYDYLIPLSAEEWTRLEGVGRDAGIRLMGMTLSVVLGEWAVSVGYEPRWAKGLLPEAPPHFGTHHRTFHRLSPLGMQAVRAGDWGRVIPEDVVRAAYMWAMGQGEDLLSVIPEAWEAMDELELTRCCLTLTLTLREWRQLERLLGKPLSGMDLSVLLEAWALAGWPGVIPAGYPVEVDWQRTPRYWSGAERRAWNE